MKKFAIYTAVFFAPIIALVVLQNIWAKTLRFDARIEDGSLYVVDRRSGEVTFCSGWDCRVIRSSDHQGPDHLDTSSLTAVAKGN